MKREPLLDLSLDYRNATGPVRVRMTNDYLFKALLQQSETTRRALVCSLLGLSDEDVRSVDVTNEIILGESASDKIIALDVNVLLNDDVTIDLEMQVVNHGDWPERSLFYACRNFTNFDRGQDYIEARPSIQIGFLDYTLFPERPKFYSMNRLMDETDHFLYTDKLAIGVVDLTKIDLATERDKRYNVDVWAKFFKCKTWEEIRMLTEQNPVLHEAANTGYRLSESERIRQQCEAREDALRRENGWKHREEKLRKELAEKDALIAELRAQLAAK